MPYGASPVNQNNPNTGFWPSLLGSQQMPNGLLSSFGHGIRGLFGQGIGLLPQFNLANLFHRDAAGGVIPTVGGPGGARTVTGLPFGGPTGYRNARGLGTLSQGIDTFAPQWATAASEEIKKRHQL